MTFMSLRSKLKVLLTRPSFPACFDKNPVLVATFLTAQRNPTQAQTFQVIQFVSDKTNQQMN